jgi:hypothetical protein
MTFLHRRLLASFPAGALLLSILPSASAGVAPGLDVRSMNARSGHGTSSHVRMGRNGNFGLVCNEGISSGTRRAVHMIDVPATHVLVDVAIHGEDVAISHDLHFRLRQTCQPYLVGGVPDTTTIAEGTTSGAEGFYMVVLSSDGSVPSNNLCAYFLESRFADDNAACASAELDMTSIRIRMLDPDVIFRDGFEP